MWRARRERGVPQTKDVVASPIQEEVGVDDQAVRKPLFTPLEPASDAGFRGRNEQRPPKPLVGGSIPSGPASLIPRL